jgi:hypothetical protein
MTWSAMSRWDTLLNLVVGNKRALENAAAAVERDRRAARDRMDALAAFSRPAAVTPHAAAGEERAGPRVLHG